MTRWIWEQDAYPHFIYDLYGMRLFLRTNQLGNLEEVGSLPFEVKIVVYHVCS